MVTLSFLRGLCGYVWVNILTLSTWVSFDATKQNDEQTKAFDKTYYYSAVLPY